MSFQDPQEQLEIIQERAFEESEKVHKLAALRDMEQFVKGVIDSGRERRFTDDRQAQTILQYVQGEIVRLHG